MFQSGGIIKGGLPIGVQLAIDSALSAHRLLNGTPRIDGSKVVKFSCGEMIINKKQQYYLFCAMTDDIPKCYLAKHTQTLKQFIKSKRKGIV